ncbi:cryptochrome DASH [Sclerotinia borealis F-4128]|uniref:Cryptochrome DASH n=1 Tax=Sclerotinia borealis (strain F-4128) TaxID=1432307 RepID=W9CPP7_SCLBF|nr:cryptochrome DASH [Sclerotinia borealis F-4128]
MPKPRVIYWFRTDLRLHDSPALDAALKLDPEAFWPIWTWDPHYVYRARVGVNRWQFLLDCQNDLSRSITKINPQSKLFLLREAPQTLFPKLFKAWRVTHLVFEKDTDAYARTRDESVMKAAKEAGVEVIIRTGRTLWDSDELVARNGGKPTMSISTVQTLGPKIGKIPRPISAPTTFPNPGNTNLDFEQESPEKGIDLNSGARENGDGDKSYKTIAGPNHDFAVPTLEELGFPAATTSHRGGETLALQTLDKLMENEEYIAKFEKPKTAPTDFEPQATTLLSPHLHFGSLSIREFYWRVKDLVAKYQGKASQTPVSLEGQLLFRDMYFGAQAAIGYEFAQTVGNAHCRFIPWHLRDPVSLISSSGSPNPNSPLQEKWLYRWTHGLTGFPFIDALMRQLRQEGWIHHLGRHAVACFLTRGGCYISWERGAEVFEELLLDHETACNVGNWQWLSCTAFYHMYYRMYSPIAFGKNWDPEGNFVRKYVPELKGLNKKFIYEPWKAPMGDLLKAGIRIEGDGMDGKKGGCYPKPMFDFGERRTVCLGAMKKAYAVGLYGNDERVKNGTWRELFGKDDEGLSGVIENKGEVGGGDEVGDGDGAIEEDERGAARTGDHDMGNKVIGQKRKKEKGQATLDGIFKKKRV